MELNLTLSDHDVNLILESLGALPFKRVYKTIGTIQSQAQAQLQEVEASEEPEHAEAGSDEALRFPKDSVGVAS